METNYQVSCQESGSTSYQPISTSEPVWTAEEVAEMLIKEA